MRPGEHRGRSDESTIVPLDEVAAPLCARPGADHYEGGRGGDLFTLTGPDVLERQGFQAGLAVAAGNSGAGPDSDVGDRLQLGDEVSDMLAASDSPRTSSVTPGGESGA
jgi:hypothetical protein